MDEIIFYLVFKIMGSDGWGLFGVLGLFFMVEVLELIIKDVW